MNAVTHAPDLKTAQAEVETKLRSLMIRNLEGDSQARTRLLMELSHHLRGFFVRRLPPNAVDAEDLVQETLLAIHIKRDTYDPAQPFTPWVYAVARYKLIDHFRRLRRRPTVPLEQAGELYSQDTPELGAIRIDLEKLLDTLPHQRRRLVEDLKIVGLS